jgi:hypothetical protein
MKNEKTTKNIKGLVTWQKKKKLRRVLSTWRNQTKILDKFENLIVPKIKRQYRFNVKLNDYRVNLHKN